MMQGKLIVLEGIDGSGKSTQYEKLCERFEAEGKEFVKISFPRYDKDSSVLIREYLNGDYGSVTITGGTIKATGGRQYGSVDVGAGYGGTFDAVTISEEVTVIDCI